MRRRGRVPTLIYGQQAGVVTAVPAAIHGSLINATNTGITYAGVDPASLTTTGTTTYTTANQVITGKAFTGKVSLNASGIVLDGCTVTLSGTNAIGVSIGASNVTVRNCTITSGAGTSFYKGIDVPPGSDNATILRNDISRGENLITNSGSGTLIQENYLHEVAIDSNPSGHGDVIEVFRGSPTIRGNRLVMGPTYSSDAIVNIAPFAAGATVSAVIITDNFIDGGNAHILVDDQTVLAGGAVTGVQVLRNVFGGHTTTSVYGRYKSFQNNDARAVVNTAADQTTTPTAVLWPSSGADQNTWGECSDLTPDKTGLVALAA